ncbi:plasmid pRiA4b ORF-3 family protein [Actinokineospora sp. NBRC 105648]|uniref:plasmid pRiA4b ORF-3 family protein n=1 Tax=Actinokineospora sp. NBRC 105648 TaxID=3032206 RepID=UPI002553ECBA|nr:plasmid pRiA4b ORF-3 family protein [Actinokineospora sp. NBRC 105648]
MSALIDELLKTGAALATSPDPLDTELIAASFLSIGTLAAEAFADALVQVLIPDIEARGGVGAVALLLCLGAIAGDARSSEAAAAAAGRLVRSGAPEPAWAAELATPVRATDLVRLTSGHAAPSMLVGVFHRARRSHAVLVAVDPDGVAQGVFLTGARELPDIVRAIAASGDLRPEAISPAEYRLLLEQALDARLDRDLTEGLAELSEDEEDGPGYSTLSVLLRARLATLPWPEDLAAEVPDAVVLPYRKPPRRRSSGQAPVYQLKIGLSGAKPPIWRRLEVPADTTLAGLHQVIQRSFDWDDSHLHEFETPFGEFGVPEQGLGHPATTSVTLEQVAPGAGARFGYRYDFGDSWAHDILVEKVLDRRPDVAYPRCTGGRRAAPPEDCGGLWGYAGLVETLADPAHEDHAELLRWLGIADAAEFDPARFSAAEVTEALSDLR